MEVQHQTPHDFREACEWRRGLILTIRSLEAELRSIKVEQKSPFQLNPGGVSARRQRLLNEKKKATDEVVFLNKWMEQNADVNVFYRRIDLRLIMPLLARSYRAIKRFEDPNATFNKEDAAVARDLKALIFAHGSPELRRSI